MTSKTCSFCFISTAIQLHNCLCESKHSYCQECAQSSPLCDFVMFESRTSQTIMPSFFSQSQSSFSLNQILPQRRLPSIISHESPPSPLPTSSTVECSICLENLDVRCPTNPCFALPCAHVFHQKCISLWREKSVQCPICKRTEKDVDSLMETLSSERSSSFFSSSNQIISLNVNQNSNNQRGDHSNNLNLVPEVSFLNNHHVQNVQSVPIIRRRFKKRSLNRREVRRCPALLKFGERKGEVCNAKLKRDFFYCKRHHNSFNQIM